MTRGPSSGVRLAELVAALSLATDLGLGQPQEHVLRQTVIATRLAAAAGLGEEEQAAVFYVSLMAWVGCVADSHELARWFGDDVRLRADSYEVDKAGLPMMGFLIGHLAVNGGSMRRLTTVGRFLAGGFRDAMGSFVAHCETTADIADRLDLPAAVRRALAQAFARWDGRGSPPDLAGEAIDPVMRVVQVADDAEVFHRLSGVQGAVAMLGERSGREFDPRLVALCLDRPERIFAGLDELDAWDSVIDRCSGLDRTLDEDGLRSALAAFGDYADLKSPWFLGHSAAVAELASAAAQRCALSDVDLVAGAARVARLGAIGVSAGIWNKPGPLTAMEWERVRTVPYLTERVLCRQPRLARLGVIAAMAHERMDGSGYPRGLAGAAIPMPARVVAAADVYQSMREARPHRPALDAATRETALRDAAVAGVLDPTAVHAVLAAAGHRVPRRRSTAAGLTDREEQVLVLLVRGHSNRQIAEQLTLSTRTVGTHVEHIYRKIGARTRGAAAMFAMRHGLVDATQEPQKIG
jgi:HD-GYP domain-containing protein (c-di-GMP phosphodiesterase class II)